MAQATAAPGSAHSAVAKENKKAIQARNLRTGLLFTAPALIVLAIFVFYPAIKTFITSLTSDRIYRAGKFVGFDNYVKLFQSADFWTDVKNTLVYAVAYAPIVVIVALAFALLLNRKDLKFVGFFRPCMFLPFVISPDRRRHRMAVHPLPVARPGSVLDPAADRHRARRSARHPRNRHGGHRLHHRVEKLRLLHGHLPRRSAGHLRRTV